MIPIQVPLVGISRWAPAPYSPVRRDLGQQAPAPAPAPVPAVVPKPSLLDIDAPLTAFVTDVVATSSTAILGYSFGRAHSRWSTFFWLLSGITGFKALIDLSRLK